MTGRADASHYGKLVKENLFRAIEARNGGDTDKAEDLYLDACINMLMYSRVSSRSERSDNLMRSKSILDGLIGINGSGGGGGTDASMGWKILSEIGVERPIVPETRLTEVAGLEEAKKELVQSLIYPLKYRELSEKFGVTPSGGVLLYGPPGTGKTYIAKALANEAGANFINVSPSRLYSQWFGEFEKNISKLFKAARLLSPSLVFFDEVEALAPSRGSRTGEQVSRRGVSQLLMEMEGFEKNNEASVFILAATNRPWDIDDALLRPGRFDTRVYVGLPDKKSRAKMFALYLRNAGNLRGKDYLELADSTEGYSGADISYICKRVSARLLAKSIESGHEVKVDLAAVKDMISEVKPSVSARTVEKYDNYSRSTV